MSIKIVTDSTCDLPATAISEYGISVVPLYINLGSKSYLDEVELSRDDFYKQLPDYDPFPSTAAPGPERFRQTYDGLINAGATEILSIHVSGKLSTTVNNARLGAKQITEIPVTVFDSKQLSLGLGFLVLEAAKAAHKGQPIQQITIQLENQILRTHTFAVLNTLEFLKRGGRVSGLMAGLGSLLQIRPLFKVDDGRIIFEKIRTRKRAIRRLVNALENLPPLTRAAIIHSHAPEQVQQLQQQILHLLPQSDTGLVVEISPIVGAHVGPGAVGFVGVTADIS